MIGGRLARLLEPDPDLRESHRRSKWLAWGLLADFLVYACVVEIVRRWRAPFDGFADLRRPEEVRWAAFGLALLMMFVIPAIARRPLKDGPSGDAAQDAGRLQKSALLAYAGVEFVALLGLGLFLATGGAHNFYAMLGVAAFYLAVYAPRFPEWERWAAGARGETGME